MCHSHYVVCYCKFSNFILKKCKTVMILSFHQKEIVSNYKEKNHQTLKGLTGEVNNNDHLVTMDCSH